MSSAINQRIPAIYISKYNRFVDNILGRINKILRRSYDPVRVKLSQTTKNQPSKKNKNKNEKKRKQSKRHHTTNKRTTTSAAAVSTSGLKSENKMADIELDMVQRSLAEAELKLKEMPMPASTTSSATHPHDTRKLNNNETSTKRSHSNNNNSNSKNNRRKNGGNKNKTKATSTKTKSQKARATLFGLSSLRRDGDVSVNLMADYTTVKTNFMVGPLTLKVEKEFGRGAKRELKSATATTAEMHGKLSLRIVPGGAATLHAIRVLQPKQVINVRIDSIDDHDRTREFVWKRSAQIARMVSQKLTSATKSMLKPAPKN